MGLVSAKAVNKKCCNKQNFYMGLNPTLARDLVGPLLARREEGDGARFGCLIFI